MSSTCFTCGAREHVVPVMRPVLDENGQPVYDGWDEKAEQPIPKMEQVGYRMTMEHDPAKHGIKPRTHHE